MQNGRTWASIYLYYDDLAKLVHDVVVPIRNEVYQKKLATKFIFNKSWLGGENIIIIYEVTDNDDSEAIINLVKKRATAFFTSHPAPQKQIELPVNDWFLPFPNNHVECNENFQFDIMETGGLHASILAEDLLTNASNTILDLIELTGAEWNVDSALGIAIQFHVALAVAFDNDIENVALFYESFFNNLLKVTEGGNSDQFKNELIEGLESNFADQRDSLVEFISHITASIQQKVEFEDEWMNEWVRTCQVFAEQLKRLQSQGGLITPEQFVANDDIPVQRHVQEMWIIMEYYLRSINSQLGIENAYEFNLVYALQACLKFIVATKEA